MPQRLSSVELDEVSLVDKPANQLAKVVLLKRADGEGECTKDCPMLKMKKPDGTMDMSGCPLKKAECIRKDDVTKAPAGIQFSIGYKTEGGSEIQSVVFDSKLWDKERAAAWLKDHDMSAEKVDEKPNTLRYRQHDPEDYTRIRMITPGAQTSKIMKALKAEDSWSRIQEAVSETVRKDQPSSIWIRDLFEDSVVFDQDGQTFRVGYALDHNDAGELNVTLEKAVPVEVAYQEAGKVAEPVVVPEPQISAELLMRFGKLNAHVELLHNKVKKMNSCHIPSGPKGGEFCSGGGREGGGGTGGGSKGKYPSMKLEDRHRKSVTGAQEPTHYVRTDYGDGGKPSLKLAYAPKEAEDMAGATRTYLKTKYPKGKVEIFSVEKFR